MAFGFSNTSTSFQDYINKILAKKFNIFVIAYLYNFLIYIKDFDQAYINAVCLVLNILEKNGLFANLKKYHFHKNKVRFLGYVVLAQGVRMKDKKVKAIKNWSEPKLIQDISLFLGFANFYQPFIQSFNKINGPFIFILKIITNSLENLLISVDVVEKDEMVGRDISTS